MKVSALAILMFGCIISISVNAKIDIKGTDAEKAEIQKAIDDMKASSPATKKLYEELEARSETVVIKFGADELNDIATANTKTNVVIIDKSRLDKLKLIGTGKALEQMTLPYVIVHEALGHILNNLKGQPAGEAAAMATTNQARIDNKSIERSEYLKVVDGKLTVPFKDGSSVDTTDALKSPAGGTGKASKLVGQEGVDIKISGSPSSSGDSISVALASPAPVRFSFEDGSTQYVNLTRLSLLFQNSLDTGEFTLEGNLYNTDIILAFDSFNLDDGKTGTNILKMWDPTRNMVGHWEFSPDLLSFSFYLSGDFLWQNDLFSNGYAGETLAGTMTALQGGGWNGIATLAGVKAYAVAEPPTLAMLILAVLLGWGCRVRSFICSSVADDPRPIGDIRHA
ncbi:MAG: hypothetical protein KUL88_00210 [Rhizobium sp.]|nr:hypothetical protein [Rhizobium sp.]